MPTREYYLRNREKVRASNAEWARKNRERASAAERERRARNREQINAKQREWRRNNQVKVKAQKARERARTRAAKPLRMDVKALLHGNEIYSAAVAALGSQPRGEFREDILSMMVLAVLEGEVTVDQLRPMREEFVCRHFRMFDHLGTLHLDDPVFPGAATTLLDYLTTDNAVLL